ncbi:hypothetical protein ACA910_021394 [Epithemia clementina (nom. ined.)]
MPKPVVKKFKIGVARNPPRSPPGLGRPYMSDEEENAPSLETVDTDDDDDDDNDNDKIVAIPMTKRIPEGRDPNVNRKSGIVRPCENGKDAAAGEGEGATDGEPQDWEDDIDDSYHRRRFNRNKHLPDRGDSDDEENAEGRDPNLNRKGDIVRPGENGKDAAGADGEGGADGEANGKGDMDDRNPRRRFNRNKHLPDRGDSNDENAEGRDRKGGIV